MDQLRRSLVLNGLSGCALCLPGAAALARVPPSEMTALVSPDYEPTDLDERGMWQACERLEQELAASNLLITEPGLDDYLRSVVSNLLGDMASDLRIYPVWNPDFNASMAPNGMMIVHSGFLARVRNEAQLAAVLGHECGHYLRLHSVRNWRDVKAKSALMAVVAIGGAAATGATGSNWYDLANAINSSLLLSIFSYSRSMESEADTYGLKLLRDAGYTPKAASEVWSQLIEERKASAAARNKRYRDHSDSALSTHPPSEARMRDLAMSAVAMERRNSPDDAYDARRAQWLAAIGSLRPSLIEEQIKLNDPGASFYLLNSLARDGWNGLLRYCEGEAHRLRGKEEDAELSAQSYAAAVQFDDAPAEAWRAHGYAQIKAGAGEEGRRALARYLELQPNAVDAAMVRFTLGQ